MNKHEEKLMKIIEELEPTVKSMFHHSYDKDVRKIYDTIKDLEKKINTTTKNRIERHESENNFEDEMPFE